MLFQFIAKYSFGLADNNFKQKMKLVWKMLEVKKYYESDTITMSSKQNNKYEDYIMVRTDPKSHLSVWMKLPPQGR